MRRTIYLLGILIPACGNSGGDTPHDAARPPDAGVAPPPDPTVAAATRMIEEGRQTFRYDTFGDEAFWTDTFRLHEAVAGVSPATALSLGLKVEVAALPQDVIDALAAGEVDPDE